MEMQKDKEKENSAHGHERARRHNQLMAQALKYMCLLRAPYFEVGIPPSSATLNWQSGRSQERGTR